MSFAITSQNCCARPELGLNEREVGKTTFTKCTRTWFKNKMKKMKTIKKFHKAYED